MHPGKGADVQNWGTGRKDTKELVRKAVCVYGAGGIAREKDKQEELAAKPRP